MYRLKLTTDAERSLERATQDEVESAVNTFAEILRNPEPDGIAKFSADYFPDQSGIVETANDIWYMAYIILQDEIHVIRLYRLEDLLDALAQHRLEP